LPFGENIEMIWLGGIFSRRAEDNRKIPAQRIAISITFSQLAPKRREKAERETRERRKGENLFLTQFQSGWERRSSIRGMERRKSKGIPLNWGRRKGTARRRNRKMKGRLTIFASQILYSKGASLLNQINYGRN